MAKEKRAAGGVRISSHLAQGQGEDAGYPAGPRAITRFLEVEGSRGGQSKCGEERGQFSIAGFHDLKGANIQRRAAESGKLILKGPRKNIPLPEPAG